MRIIDILNKIANGEKVPKIIKTRITTYIYDEFAKDYVDESQEDVLKRETRITNDIYYEYYLFRKLGSGRYLCISQQLNYEVGIIGENMNREERVLKYINSSDDFLVDGKRYCENDFYNDVEDLAKENKILRENAEHNDKVVDKVNWENQILKKQLEEYKRLGFEHLNDKCNKLENQQKKFIEYLEYQVKLQEELNDNHLATGFEEILSKYKEIIDK